MAFFGAFNRAIISELMKINFLLAALVVLLSFSLDTQAAFGPGNDLQDPFDETLSVAQDTVPIRDRTGDFIQSGQQNPFDLNDPGAITQEVEYDPATNTYKITETIGSDYYRAPTYMTFSEYMDYRAEKQRNEYFQQLSGLSSGGTASGLKDPIGAVDVKNNLIDRLFGGSEVTIKPQGSIDLTLGGDYSRTENPNLTLRQQRNGGFDFDMAIQMNVTGSIGEKLNLSTNYNTQATFGFENQMKLDYDTDAFSEDEIIKKIEAGDVSLPLKGTLIQGAQKLFGLKTGLQFGRLKLEMIAAQQRSQQQQLQIQGGAQVQEYEVRADEYDENRHFFLSHYNRESFEKALANLPQINSLFRVKNIEIWVTNTRNETEDIVDIVALADMGEPTRLTSITGPGMVRNPDQNGKPLPGFLDKADSTIVRERFANDLLYEIKNTDGIRDIDNTVNMLQNTFKLRPGVDFKKVSARKLRANEFTFNAELGTISLNVNLQPDDVLGVAYEYSYNGENYQVGEMAQDVYNPEELGVLFVKMLKSSITRVDFPIWDLMMKNVYSLGAFQVGQEDFLLDIFYEDPGAGFKRFLPETNLAGQPLLRVFNLDRLNVQGDPCADGIFDFVPGITINPRNGRVMFPVLEPFGADLVKDMDPEFREDYEYFHLYDSTLTRAREYPDLNRFAIRGSYKSSISSEISLGAFNIPENSVRVTAGGVQLLEGSDYEVDYNIGKVRILNDAYLNSGTPINVSFEDNTLFGIQNKSMVGVRADYEFNKNLNVGATYLHLFERPFTQKVNIGDDPISNRMYGLDVNYSGEAPWLTKMVDAIPFIQTKEESSITFAAEAAYLKPGHARAININQEDDDEKKDKGGTVYLDDFEGSTTGFDLRNPTTRWVMASVPQDDLEGNNPMFPESQFIDNTISGVNRAKLAWYRADDFVRSAEDREDPYRSRVDQTEIFPNRAVLPTQGNAGLPVLDLHFIPGERGPYNFDLPGDGTAYSSGLTDNGLLKDPTTRWGGIMRALPNNDFEAANIEYIDFWMLNPFIFEDNPGDLYFNLGNISEDILRDSRRSFENGIPGNTDDQMQTRTDSTSWGRVPRVQAFTDAFDLDPDNRAKQDVGFDGLSDQGEQEIFGDILNQYQAALNPAAYDAIFNDPANDNFEYFNDEGFTDANTLWDRYENNNNPQGNSAVSANNRVNSATNLPDTEDLNDDNSLNEDEQYFQYHIPLRPVPIDGGRSGLDVNNPYITDFIEEQSTDPNRRIWYRFKIPVEAYTSAVGGIQDFRSIQFIRMYMKNFNNPVTLRFATLELTRNQWRRYRRPLETVTSNTGLNAGPGDFSFVLNDVNLEENGAKLPFNYVLPPGLVQEQAFNTSFPDRLQNEQSLSLVVNDLPVDSAVGIYKILNLDMRVYEELEMFIHCEELIAGTEVDDEDLALFIRLGSDFQNNFYEYEIPLTLSRDVNLMPNSAEYRQEVWRVENDMNINLKELIEIKKQRNAENFPLDKFYVVSDQQASEANPSYPERTYRLKGNPNLGLVKGVMVGVVNRNTGDIKNHSAEIWINEMRLNGLDERGGLAGLARVDFQLADFGTLQASTAYSSIGYGGIEQKLADRSREEVFQYDVAANLELSKFFGEDSGLKIPAYASISQTLRTPQFDPYDLDIPLREKIDEATNRQARDSIKNQAQDYTNIKSFNLTNVRKTRTGSSDKKPMPWDIENFSATYAYVETERRNPIISSDETKTYTGGLDYNYQIKPLYIEPFKKLIKKDKYLKLLSEANLNLIPNSFTFSTNLNREKQTTEYRFTDLAPEFKTFFNKRFTWDRDYNLSWDITKALKFNFTANNRAIIDELKALDDDGTPRDEKVLRGFINDNLRNFGRTKDYSHNIGANYTLPFKKIPFLDFITVKATYGATYSWAGSAIGGYSGLTDISYNPGIADTLGNVIQNTQSRQINGDLNFETLYKKWKYLDKINRGKSKKRGRGSSRSSTRGDDKSDDKNGDTGRTRGTRGSRDGKGKSGSSDPRSPSPEDLSDAKVEGKGGRGTRAGGKNPNGGDDKNGKGKDGKGKDIKGKKDEKKRDRDPSMAERILIRPLLMLRKARFTYAENFGTVVPGYIPRTQFIGTSDNFTAPGLDFVAGLQPRINPDDPNDWLQQAASDGWISGSVFQNQRVSQTYSQNYNGKISIEPFDDFKIELEANRRFDENKLLLFKDFEDDGIASFGHKDFQNVGSFQVSYFALNTLFGNDSGDLFSTFENNRVIISNRIGTGTHQNTEEEAQYAQGQGRVQESVLVPAFLSAYTGQDAATIPVSDDFTNELFSTLPRLNWSLNYNGLSKLGIFKDIFQNVKLSHGYQSTMTVNQFNNDQAFNRDIPFALDDNFNYYSRFQVPNIVIDERFNPLLGLSVRTKGGMDINLDFKKARNLSMSFVNFVLAEQITQEYVFGFGYTMEDVYIPLFYGKKGKRKSARTRKKTTRSADRNGKDDPDVDPKDDGKAKPKGNDLNFKIDFSLRDDKTENFTLDQGFSEITRGVRTLTLAPSVDYDVNEKLNVRLFFDHRSTVPATSQGFPQTNTSGGVVVKFTLD